MSGFGFSCGDIALLLKGIKLAYTGWKDAPGDLADVAVQLDSFNTVVKRLEKLARLVENGSTTLEQEQVEDYASIVKGSQDAVNSLNEIVKHYSTVEQGVIKRHWHRFRAGTRTDEIHKLQQRLTGHTNQLNTLLVGDTYISAQDDKATLRLLGDTQKRIEASIENNNNFTQQVAIQNNNQALVLAANHTKLLQTVLAAVQEVYAEQKRQERVFERAARDKKRQSSVSETNAEASNGEATNANKSDSEPAQGEKPDNKTGDKKEEGEPDEWRSLRSELIELGFDLMLLREHEGQIRTFFYGLLLQHRYEAFMRNRERREQRRRARRGSTASLSDEDVPADPGNKIHHTEVKVPPVEEKQPTPASTKPSNRYVPQAYQDYRPGLYQTPSAPAAPQTTLPKNSVRFAEPPPPYQQAGSNTYYPSYVPPQQINSSTTPISASSPKQAEPLSPAVKESLEKFRSLGFLNDSPYHVPTLSTGKVHDVYNRSSPLPRPTRRERARTDSRVNRPYQHTVDYSDYDSDTGLHTTETYNPRTRTRSRQFHFDTNAVPRPSTAIPYVPRRSRVYDSEDSDDDDPRSRRSSAAAKKTNNNRGNYGTLSAIIAGVAAGNAAREWLKRKDQKKASERPVYFSDDAYTYDSDSESPVETPATATRSRTRTAPAASAGLAAGAAAGILESYRARNRTAAASNDVQSGSAPAPTDAPGTRNRTYGYV